MAEQANTDTGSLMSGLPPSHVVRHYTTFRDLDAEARKVLQSLQANRDGNQYMVLLNVSARVRDKLDNDHKTCLGAIEYRFQWEGTTGFIKDVPSERHDIATDIMVKNIDRLHNDMGLPISDSIWARTTTYSSGSGRGKQADDSFVPRSRLPHGSTPGGGQQWLWRRVSPRLDRNCAKMRSAGPSCRREEYASCCSSQSGQQILSSRNGNWLLLMRPCHLRSCTSTAFATKNQATLHWFYSQHLCGRHTQHKRSILRRTR